jgi:DNA invertase Pin-like site-specific DNA recombinase
MSERHSTNGYLVVLVGDGAVYVRISDDEQDVARQGDRINAFLKLHGATVPQRYWFKDEGWARDTAAVRPEFNRLLKLAEAGVIKWIVVSERDRFGTTDADEFVHYRYLLRKWGVRLYDANGTDWTKKDIATVIISAVDGEKSEREQHTFSERSLSSMSTAAKAGEWMGGPVRLGFDVACCSRASGAELWRVVFEGRHRRLKVYPDGRTERYDGKGNFPAHQENFELLRLVPSKDQSRINAAVTVFKRFAAEAVSPTQLAHWLNGLGFRNGGGGTFQGVHVEELLRCPLYVGRRTWNRGHLGKFRRLRGGRLVEELNYGKTYSKNDQGDWVEGEQSFEPLVPVDVFEAVQAKLDRPRRAKAPPSAGLFLSGLVVCGTCGQGMSGKAEGGRPVYHCSTYHNACRARNRRKCRCRRNTVPQTLLETYVNAYLDEAGHRLELLAGDAGHHLTDKLREQQDVAWSQFQDGITRLTSYLARNRPEEFTALVADFERWWAAVEVTADSGTTVAPGPSRLAEKYGDRIVTAHKAALRAHKAALAGDLRAVSGDDFAEAVADLYSSTFDPEAVKAELAALDAEHDRLTKVWPTLPTERSRAKVKAEMDALEAKMGELERQQAESGAEVCDHYREVQVLSLAIADARQSLASEHGEQALRRKAEVIRSVVGSIVVHFDPDVTGNQHSRLVDVEVRPPEALAPLNAGPMK